MIIKSIEVVGKNVRPAVLYFSKGLNVVAGPSNTGKSYLIECIKFALGASAVPKPIKESKGYDTVILTMEEGTESYKISRQFILNSPTTVTTSDGQQVVLKGRHKPDLKNISNYFLSKIGLNNKLLLYSKEKHTTRALSLRTLEPIFVVDEDSIVARHSPLGTGQRTETTLEKSLLKTLLTGTDESRAKDTRDTDESAESIKRRIKQLEELMRLIFPETSAPTQSAVEIHDQSLKLDQSIKILDTGIQELVLSKGKFLQRRKEELILAANIENEIGDAKALRQRFSLLMEKYESDRSRVVGLSEAALLLENYGQVSCPTCGSHFDEATTDIDVDALLQSARAEAHKIEVQMNDLQSAIVQLDESILSAFSNVERIKIRIAEMDAELQADVGERLNQLVFSKNEYSQKKIELATSLARLEGNNAAQVELDRLRSYEPQKISAYEISDFSEQLTHFVENVEDILKRWGFPEYAPTKFLDKSRDLEFGGTPRKDFGKGYRAVAFSAFVLGLMKTLMPSNRHPGFVVLDSPLTTYKPADIEQGEDDESIEPNMVYSVYRDLCDAYNENQVIIFDNQEPEVDLLSSMNYQHFTRNNNLGRYGFFPVN
ncbi:AAA family ATPase [Janthinobacterium lividum]